MMKKMLTKKCSGATAMEYVLIVSIMAGVIVLVWVFFGDAIQDRMREVAEYIKNAGCRSREFRPQRL